MKQNGMKLLLSMAFLAITVMVVMPAAAASSRIEIVDLGTLYASDTFSGGVDVNERGEDVGWSGDGTQLNGFLWTSRDGMISVGSLGGNRTSADGINNHGQVVGLSENGVGHPRAFLWTLADGMRDLGTLGGDWSQAYGINEKGQVVGVSGDSLGQSRAFLWTEADGMVDLGTLGGGESVAYTIGGQGQIVGRSKTAAGDWRAFLWTAQDGMVNLGSLGGGSAAYGVNSRGQVVGESCLSGGFDPAQLECTDGSLAHAFLWTAQDGMVDLGTLGGAWSWAAGINNRGQVSGTSVNASGQPRAFLWTAADGMVNLGTLHGIGQSTGAWINELGQVVGSSGEPGASHAVLWTVH